ncbi:MAG: glycosyltransferase [Gammaproteobacteria bacterium]|nr:glycosyltransferase [Gammaproteobacteria bacterium]
MKRVTAVGVLTAVYGLAVLISKVLKPFGRREGVREIMVVGTFHNPNWFHAHVTPLTRSGVDRVYLVCDEPVDELERLVYLCPPPLLNKLFSRAGAKFIWGLLHSFRVRPDLYMGYHIFPAAVSALVLARLFGRLSSFQVTSGQLEIEGGGWGAENKLLVALQGPSRLIERLAHAVTSEFDSVIVRGTQARAYVERHSRPWRIEIITGSVDTAKLKGADDGERSVDITFVGRMSEYKRPDGFVDVVARAADRCPDIRARMIGDGPLFKEVAGNIAARGLAERIDMVGQVKNVYDYLLDTRIFAITSRWEGLSIALMEAMCAGAVPIVFDVGDLKDIVIDGETGYVVPDADVSEFSARVTEVLKTPGLCERLSVAASTVARARCDVGVIAERWRRHFECLTDGREN